MQSDEIIERFYMLGMAPSEIGKCMDIPQSLARNVIVGWWADDKEGIHSNNAVRRWVDEISDFLDSLSDEVTISPKGYDVRTATKLIRVACEMTGARSLQIIPGDRVVTVRRRRSWK